VEPCGQELLARYRYLLAELGTGGSLSSIIFHQTQNKLRTSDRLHHLIGLIDRKN